MHGMAQQGRQPLNDGQSESEAKTAFAGGIAELVIFAEYCPKILLGDADAGIPDLDAQHSPAATASKQYLAILSVFQRV